MNYKEWIHYSKEFEVNILGIIMLWPEKLNEVAEILQTEDVFYIDDNKHIYKTMDNLRDNHIAHLQQGINDLKTDVQSVKNDVRWIKTIGAVVLAQAIAFVVDLASRFFN
jgi:replicative DNA helicase